MIVTICHSGGNADIGNKLAELLMPELDEKVIFSMTAQTLDKNFFATVPHDWLPASLEVGL